MKSPKISLSSSWQRNATHPPQKNFVPPSPPESDTLLQVRGLGVFAFFSFQLQRLVASAGFAVRKMVQLLIKLVRDSHGQQWTAHRSSA